MTLSIAHGHADTAIGNAAGTIHFRLVLLSHDPSALVAHYFGVAAFVAAGGETIVNPKERTDLHAGIGFSEYRHLLGIDADYLSGTEVMGGLEAEIGEGRRLACHGQCTFLLANDDGRAAP